MQVLLPLENKVYDFPVPDQLQGLYHDSIAKICPFCLRLWAILKVKTTQFSIQGTCCVGCWSSEIDLCLPHYSPIAGSLLDDCGRMGTQWELLDYLPRPLLEREFLIHLKVAK